MKYPMLNLTAIDEAIAFQLCRHHGIIIGDVTKDTQRLDWEFIKSLPVRDGKTQDHYPHIADAVRKRVPGADEDEVMAMSVMIIMLLITFKLSRKDELLDSYTRDCTMRGICIDDVHASEQRVREKYRDTYMDLAVEAGD